LPEFAFILEEKKEKYGFLNGFAVFIGLYGAYINKE